MFFDSLKKGKASRLALLIYFPDPYRSVVELQALEHIGDILGGL